MSVAALVATLILNAVTVNRLVRRKLRLSLFLLGVYALQHVALLVRPELHAQLGDRILSMEQLAFAAAIINLLVVALVNPLREDRIPDRFPSILQDASVIGMLVLVATFVFQDELLTTSAVSAVVVGFALQDTLGNAFAGLAIQSEKPFHVGHWVRVGEFEGRVSEVTWRATKLRTKSGNFVVVPNNVVGKEAIINFSEPALPTRLDVEVGASYLAQPNAVKAAMLEAVGNAPLALKSPAPDVLLVSFDSSAITYRARFWIDDYEKDEIARNQVRTAIYYAFARHGIEIPYPIQVEYSREWPADAADADRRERDRVLALVDLFASLDEQQRREIAAGSVSRCYGSGDAIVRQGEPGDSMYVVCSGAAVVMLENGAARHEVATIRSGGYFGEMSLLTGDPRSATVIARGDTALIEIGAELFRRLAAANPVAVEQIGATVVSRRAGLEAAKAAATAAGVVDAPATFRSRMKKFLRMA